MSKPREGFGLVVGVDRGGQAEELAANGADIVVSDLGELLVVDLSRSGVDSDGDPPTIHRQ